MLLKIEPPLLVLRLDIAGRRHGSADEIHPERLSQLARHVTTTSACRSTVGLLQSDYIGARHARFVGENPRGLSYVAFDEPGTSARPANAHAPQQTAPDEVRADRVADVVRGDDKARNVFGVLAACEVAALDFRLIRAAVLLLFGSDGHARPALYACCAPVAESALRYGITKGDYMKRARNSPRSGGMNLARRFNAGKVRRIHISSRQRRVNLSVVADATRGTSGCSQPGSKEPG